MDRPLIEVGELPCAEDFLFGAKAALYGVGYLSQATIGSSTGVAGFAIAPTGPASLSFTIGTGSIYASATVDASAYGVLGTDSNTILKQGILAAPVTLTVTPPATSGFSQVYIVQVGYSDVDNGSVLVQFYNSDDPTHPSSSTQNTIRQGQATVQLKAGTAASTGSQTIPSADPGFTALWAVTVANGATTVTSANWTRLAIDQYSSPWFPNLESLDGRYLKLPFTNNFFVNGAIGNDTLYDGTSATISGPHGPFATLPGAYSRIIQFASTGGVNVNIAAGNYAGVAISTSFIGSWNFVGAGAGSTTINGSLTGTTTSDKSGLLVAGATITISNMTVTGATGAPCINANAASIVTLGTMTFAPASGATAIFISGGKVLSPSPSSTWTLTNGTYASFLNVTNGGNATLGQASVAGLTIALGTSTMSGATMFATACGTIIFSPTAVSLTGTVTGSRFSCTTAGGISAPGQGLSYIQGSTAGTVSSPGWYVS